MRRLSSDKVRLQDILEAIENVMSCNLQMTSPKKDVHAACYNIAIIGEAARHLSDEIKAQNTIIPWREIINMRNIIMHEYSKVDMQSLLDVSSDDLPVLQSQIIQILKQLDNQP